MLRDALGIIMSNTFSEVLGTLIDFEYRIIAALRHLHLHVEIVYIILYLIKSYSLPVLMTQARPVNKSSSSSIRSIHCL